MKSKEANDKRKIMKRITLGLTAIIGVFVLSQIKAKPVFSQSTIGANELIDGVPRTNNLNNAGDLIQEINEIADMIAIEYELNPNKVFPPGADFWHGRANFGLLWSKGRAIYSKSQLIEFIDNSDLRSRFSQALKSEVQATLLNLNYFAMERAGSIGYRTGDRQHDSWLPVLRPGDEAIDQQWWGDDNWDLWELTGYSMWLFNGRTNNHVHWEGLLGLWAYAYYTGDWQLIQDNWEIIRQIRNSAVERPSKTLTGSRPEKTAYNSWIMGAVAYARMEKELNGSVSSDVLSGVNRAIGDRINEGLLGVEECAYTTSGGVYYTLGWDEWTPEIGRLIKSGFGNELIIMSEFHDNEGCIRFWREADMSHENNGESQLDFAWNSFPIYQGRVAARAQVQSDGSWTYDQTARDELRLLLPQPVVARTYPYHHSAFHLQNLVALTRAHGTTQWNSEPLPTATQGTNTPTPTLPPTPGDANGDNKVDGIDYVIWLNNYNTNTTEGASRGDFNGNGKVDGIDYVIWLNNYNTNTGGGAAKGDFNNDGKVDGIDYVVWLNNYGR